jgi:hypothetical protein
MTQPAPVQPPAQPAQPPAQPAPVPQQPPAHPAPIPAPPPQQPPAQPAPPAQQPAQGRQPSDPGTGDDLPYYQEGVPWRNLPADQQLAYWMHRSRKHEDRVASMRDYDELKGVKNQYDQLVTSTQSEHERAIAEARRQGEQTAMARGNTMLVEAYARAAATAHSVDDDAVTEFLETSRLDAFIVNGQVDTAKVYRHVSRMAPRTAGQQAGVPAAPAVPAPPVAQAGQWPQQPGVATTTLAPGQPAPQWQYGQQPVPAAPQWAGQQVPAAPPGQPGQQPAAPGAPDFGQGVFSQAPPSGLEAGRAAARARFGDQIKPKSNPQAA